MFVSAVEMKASIDALIDALNEELMMMRWRSDVGLYVSKLTVELMGGEILVPSAGCDKGSTFTVRFPVAMAT